ncbi:MAG TPA: glycine zipper domain-containing protein [Anaerohalosphaeraceae bacterium]|jgi:hypothetical protein|nr:glycine zipper domain-containing protein [Anaerohalosphaeraceae bacterium]HRT51854.1 glycine zipper domain-containing protein [Anaerohalosphaeraceae bacterium]HRT87892.1 glycine zipper domain-containing protein [Anaerohalosphaeraceae bacterium]
MKRVAVWALALGAGVAMVAGCGSDAGNTALIGTAVGAGVGALAGGDTEATLIGGAIGGGAGYMIGNESDKKKTQQEIAAVRAEQDVITVWVTNSNGSQIPVRLRKDGPGYVGPKGERYPSLPTEDQLREMYGM